MKKALLFVCGFIATSMVIVACGELTGPTSPETPVNVTATLTGPTTATITWARSAQSDGVISFNVLRNGQKVGETEGLSFTDTGLGEKATYKYTVSANCTSGVLSDPSPESAAATVTTLDITGPRIVQINPSSNQTGVSTGATVAVTFNEPIDPNTISTTTFSLKVTTTGANIPGTVTYTPASLTAEFKPTSALPSGTSITATVTAGVKDVAGNALQLTAGSPGIWSFTTRDETPPTVLGFTPANGQQGVGTNPPITVTFSEAMDANTINTSTITLKVTSTGAAVAGTVTYNPTTHVATFVPNAPLAVPVQYTIGVSTGVKDVAGNALVTAASSVFTTADLTPPTVIAKTPADQATNVSVMTAVTAQFSKTMDQNSITTSTFQLRATTSGTPVTGVVTYNPATNTATFTPSAPLSSLTNYTATVTTGVRDTFANPMASVVVWTFTTADVTNPTVTSVSPPDNQGNVPISTPVNITFSKAMNAATIDGTTVMLRTATTLVNVTGVVSYNPTSHVATFTPSGNLTNGTKYVVTVTTGASDTSGNPLASEFTSNFTTITVAPTVTPIYPANFDTEIPIDTAVSVVFSQQMKPSTINSTNFKLNKTSGGAAIAGVVTYNPSTLTAKFKPSAPLENNASYTVTVTKDVQDTTGTPMGADKVFSFTTTKFPSVIATSPTKNATGVPITSDVTVTFSEAMDAAAITATTFTLKTTAGSVAVTGTVSYATATHIATFHPTSSLLPSTDYTATVTGGAGGVKDASGNALPSNFVLTFRTAP